MEILRQNYQAIRILLSGLFIKYNMILCAPKYHFIAYYNLYGVTYGSQLYIYMNIEHA